MGNTEQTWLDAMLATLRLIVELFWILASWALDATRNVGPLSAGMIILGLVGLMGGLSLLMQRRLNKKLSDAPTQDVNLLTHELMFTFPGLIILLLALPFILIGRAARGIKNKASAAIKAAKAKASGENEDGEEQAQEEEEPAPVLVASIAPTFLFAAVGLALVYILGLITEPLLRLQLELSPGAPSWQYLIFGRRPELQWYLPLSRYPWHGALVTSLFWITLWWWGARLGRLALYKRVGVNLIAELNNTQTLKWWRELVGAPALWQVHPTYKLWAQWMPLATLPFLVVGWLSMAADPYRMSPSMFIIASLLALSWALHLRMEGLIREDEPEPEPEPEVETITANTWPEILKDLQRRLHIREPHLFHSPRKVEPLAMSSVPLEAEGILSPLLAELVPAPHKLTHMQHTVLRALSLQSYIHTDPPMPRGELDLSSGPQGLEDRSGQRHRNQVVLAPEGAGKSTLALLAACNHAIVHTRSTLIITRDNERAERLFARMRATVEPSTLRWNIRERRVGADLVNDLAQGIIPDIIVCSLHQLVVNLLDEPQTYSPFLQNVGLLIVDDVEDFAGAVELHAQLAIRRLNLRLRELLGVEQLGQESAPMMLVLGADSMHDTPAWARTLCGIDAISRYFDYSNEEASARDAAMMAFHGIKAELPDPEKSDKSEATEKGEDTKDKPTPADKKAKTAAPTSIEGRHHLIYRIQDLRNADDESLDVRDIIESCERLSVPWHYRPCGDERRYLGRARLHLRDEPKLYVHDPADAGVVLLEGCWADVQREIARQSRAGSAFSPVKTKLKSEDDDNPLLANKSKKKAAEPAIPIAIITLIDHDEEMAFTELNHQSTLATSLKTLPRPIVRPPTGRVVQEHMAAELTNNWVEVKDLMDIFGNPSARALMRLADHGMLMSERRVDLHPDVQLYENKVYVRATSRAIGAPGKAAKQESTQTPGLPPKVSQVELPSGDSVPVRDRTNLTTVDMADSSSAGYVYYLGRIFENALGRFVVVGRGEANEGGDEMLNDDILVEPFLGEGISSPRRRSWFRYLDAQTGIKQSAPRTTKDLLRHVHEGIAPPAEPVLIGRFPIATSLARVECATMHVATCRLGPVIHDLRQRTIYDPKLRERHQPRTMETMALAIYPNPELDFYSDEQPPMLATEEARLIASVMRAILPSMYRGGSSSIEVALHIASEHPGPNDLLDAGDGFFLFDPSPGGNGAARALHRDGVELLLRLCRVYIERVLYHDRLRARFDYWGDELEIMTDHGEPQGAQSPSDPGATNATGTWFVDLSNLESPVVRAGADQTSASAPSPTGANVRLHDQEVRSRALVWLDSRLRPEGSLSGGRTLGKYGSGNEEGEGDACDIGRCWYSKTGAITDLLWAKHRWRLDEEGGEAMADLGFDRDTAAKSRFLTPESPTIQPQLKSLTEQLQNGGFILPEDNSVWGTPRPLWSWSAGQEEAVGSDAELIKQQPLLDYQLFIGAIAAHDYKALRPLAYLLREHSRAEVDTIEGRYALIHYITKFVQGIPSTTITQPRGGGRTPVHTLLHRLGDCDSKSLILATLLRHCGLNTGLFVSLEAHDALCAVSALEGGDGADPERTRQSILAWREMMGLDQEDLMWAELPSRPGGPEGPLELYIPVDPMTHHRPGVARIEHPEQWAFVPLAAVWFRIGADQEEDEAPIQGGLTT